MIQIAPSILAADFARLGEQVMEAEKGGANRVHIDVMDGHFVPNLSMGPEVVKGLRPLTRLPLEIHLMVERPADFIDAFVRKGADSLIWHIEATPDPLPLLRHVRQLGKQAGLAIKPDTLCEVLEPFVAELDIVLCMTVHPGFSGQAFLPESPARVRQLREMIQRRKPSCDLSVDGGIDLVTAPSVVQAGANVLVAATAIYGAREGPAAAVRALLACGS